VLTSISTRSIAIVGISASITRRRELAKERSALESSNLTRVESAYKHKCVRADRIVNFRLEVNELQEASIAAVATQVTYLGNFDGRS